MGSLGVPRLGLLPPCARVDDTRESDAFNVILKRVARGWDCSVRAYFSFDRSLCFA
jgi:hypothetical protein